MPLNTAVMFGKASDEWETPQDFFDVLDKEFCFELDAAATEQNAKMHPCITAERDALRLDWQGDLCFGVPPIVWLNPPYSRVREFIAKAWQQAQNGCTVVCLVPSRTDTRWFHEFVWHTDLSCPRSGVEIRFVKGRLKFGGTGKAENSAPFPSMVVIFRPVQA